MKFTKKTCILIYVCLFCFCCTKNSYKPIKSNYIIYSKKNKLTSLKDFKNWHFKDINIDTLMGISLNRAYDTLLFNKKPRKVVVAVIDMPIDINHSSLKNNIWLNKKEIANNNLDDDKNGYIDDRNGWNFVSNKKGETNYFVNYEYTRIIREYSSKFKDKTINEINKKDSISFNIYKRAKLKYAQRFSFAEEEVKYINNISKWKKEAEEIITKFIKSNNYGLKELDSLKKIFPNNKELQEALVQKSNFIQWQFTDNYIKDYKLKAEERVNKLLNLEYDDRQIHKINSELTKDVKYGSPSFEVNFKLLDHGTKMAGIIVNISKKDELFIMPLAISSYGDERDKDIALAIKYAIDNGAKVINMSFSKGFSLRPKLVLDAIKYADSKDVLIVNGAANNGKNIDTKLNNRFPNDHDYLNNIEVSDNFLRVGSSGLYLDNNLRSSFSNFGKSEVDIFAPGEYIFTTFPSNNFDLVYGGTSSSSAITSGVAALLYSYYPNLKASQVKHILMDSGIQYNLEVNTPTKDDKNKTTPFNKLSKSGKVLNAYNALIMADSISKN